ncbi:uncharacterized protein LOC117175815 [Belonocnema kinseyi]|uniref:uncharacterized protein LOC117175815 n=1 Tax=Belonocnema kinseyi TaxID=2817044 RepID=UPI00143D4454|nr:uncharacterized protein LOC117175815 [Belonocnema kinseyi]
MRKVAGIFCFILAFLPKPGELILLPTEEEILRNAVVFHVDRYDYFRQRMQGIEVGLHEVGIIDNCIVGIIESRYLCPLLGPEPDPVNKWTNYKRVKIHINNNHANVTEFISGNDDLKHLFFEIFDPSKIRWARRV